MFALIAAAPAVVAPDINVGGELLRVILSLVGIIVLILIAGRLTRRLQARGSRGGGRRIRCMETFAVGARDRLLLLEVDGQRLLIGAGQGGMRTLHVYEGGSPSTIETAASAAVPVPVFAELLARWRRTP
jgi:flagellar protein FliO/FliZ